MPYITQSQGLVFLVYHRSRPHRSRWRSPLSPSCDESWVCGCQTSTKTMANEKNLGNFHIFVPNMAMDQYLLIPFLGGWTSIYQLFWCSPGVQGFDTLPYGLKWIPDDPRSQVQRLDLLNTEQQKPQCHARHPRCWPWRLHVFVDKWFWVA